MVQEDVSRLFKDRILVGHAIENDLKVKKNIRWEGCYLHVKNQCYIKYMVGIFSFTITLPVEKYVFVYLHSILYSAAKSRTPV